MLDSVIKVLTLVPYIPASLDDRMPWHFFQELKGLGEFGAQITVASNVKPTYEFNNIKFEKIEIENLEYGLSQIVRFFHMLMLNLPGFHKIILKSPRRAMRIARWNFEIARIIRQAKPDVIHSHWAFPASSGGILAARFLKLPHVMTLRGIDHLVSVACRRGDTLDPINQAVLSFALNRTDCITICCSDSENRLKELGFDQWHKVKRLFHAIDHNRFCGNSSQAEMLKRNLSINESKVIVCIAGMDELNKGHKELLSAFALLSRVDSDICLVLVGDGPFRLEFERQASDLHIRPKVIFVGRQHPLEIQHYIRMANLTVLPTLTEAFGNVVFESLLVGTPVVSTAVGAAKDVLPIGPFGYLCEPSNVNDLYRVIKDALTNELQARELAKAGSEYVKREMSLDCRVSQFINIYKSLLPRPSLN